MHAWARFRQMLHTRNELRLIVVMIYIVMVWQYYQTGQDVTVFMGMFRASNDTAVPPLAYNIFPLAFMAGGLALPMDQPLEYLASPDYLIYVRRPRTVVHFLRYLAIIAVYCCVFTAVQLAVAISVVTFADPVKLMTSAVCAGWMLLVLFLLVGAGYLAGNRAFGYLIAVFIYAALVSVPSIASWLVEKTLETVPNWVPAFAVASVFVAAFDLHRFRRLEII